MKTIKTGKCSLHGHPYSVEVDDEGQITGRVGTVPTPRADEGEGPGASSEPILVACPSCEEAIFG